MLHGACLPRPRTGKPPCRALTPDDVKNVRWLAARVDAALALKLLATPAVILLVSYVERRFGHAVAGLVFGFPLTSSLAAAFLAAEQGPAFVRATAPGLLAGIATFGVFLLAYAQAAARGHAWPAAVLLALAAYVPAAVAFAALAPGFLAATAVAVATLAASALLMPRHLGQAAPQPHAWWEVPARIAIATGLLVAITAAADRTGPLLTGLLLLVPASTSTVASFVLARAGPAAAVRLLRGLALGAFSFVAFFVVVGEAMGTMPTPVVFMLAGVAAIGCSGLTWRMGVSRQPSGEALA